MGEIELLSSDTIDKIAAGEVVERPLNVVKELVENAVDAKATAITVEIKGGGIELIRVTDNGSGIRKDQCKNAFLRHATSKIHTIDDLNTLSSLGFRGEALSSISAVSKTEMITKTKDSLLGTHAVVEGGILREVSDVGAPDGTTIIVRSLFYNTPARKKFLKTPPSEAAMIEDIAEKFALSNPFVSFQLIINGRTKIATSGNGELKDVVYSVFGKDIYSSLLPVSFESSGIKVYGFTAKPEFSYQARNGELYFVNGRFVRSKIINVAIEEVYRKYLMQHRFPFCVLNIILSPEAVDVNVHPQKLEVKFSDNILVSETVINALNNAFEEKDLIPEVSVDEKIIPERSEEKPFIYIENDKFKAPKIDMSVSVKQETYAYIPEISKNEAVKNDYIEKNKSDDVLKAPEPFEIKRSENVIYEKAPEFKQESLFEKKLISDEPIKRYKIIGQVFDTYWIITLDSDMYIVDQHAAHEKVNYERFVNAYNSFDGAYGQSINPPVMLHLSAIETETLNKYMPVFNKIGFEIDDFGMGSFAIRTIPLNVFGIDSDEIFHRLLDELIDKEGVYPPTFVCEKLASMSCKAAIKGGQRITPTEMEGLMKQLMSLENPYNCPHGRPVFIKITEYELEKKFKRIV